jgi:hypothetical protein
MHFMGYSFLEMAYEAMKQIPKPLTYQEIWQFAEEKGLTEKLETSGKTPWQSLGSRLYVDVRDNSESKFISVGNRPTALSQAEIGVGAIATLAWQCQIPPTCSRKREHSTPELRRDKALLVFFSKSEKMN